MDADIAAPSTITKYYLCLDLLKGSCCMWCLFQVDIHDITWELLPVHYRS